MATKYGSQPLIKSKREKTETNKPFPAFPVIVSLIAEKKNFGCIIPPSFLRRAFPATRIRRETGDTPSFFFFFEK